MLRDNSWGDLMTAGQRGDQIAYRQLLTGLEDWLRRFVADAVPPANVEQVIADTLLAVHRFRHTYRRSMRFEPWLMDIASYSLDQCRARGHRVEAEGSLTKSCAFWRRRRTWGPFRIRHSNACD
jgi:DNA-directed RNA polymerase specialized sigma24 family protein